MNIKNFFGVDDLNITREEAKRRAASLKRMMRWLQIK